MLAPAALLVAWITGVNNLSIGVSSNSLRQTLTNNERTCFFSMLDFERGPMGWISLLRDRRHPFSVQYDHVIFSEDQGKALFDALIGRPELHPVALSSRLVFGQFQIYKNFRGHWDRYAPGLIDKIVIDTFEDQFSRVVLSARDFNLPRFLAPLAEHPEFCND